MSAVRTRFAPSPTGFLHIGSARTALYCWLYARKMKGTFVLRIEDTDRERSTQASVDAILESMRWLGLDWDEGPFYQTQRFEQYAQIAKQLLAQGSAYRCYCSKERLDALREEQQRQKQKTRYDGHCRDHQGDPNQPHVIRFKNPDGGATEIDDAVHGLVTVQNKELDDLIIVRSDGTPTYNFTVVVDDWEMKISHVIRGDDHLTNTPRQINILKALGADLPRYAHLPMILGQDGQRLSKRHGAVSVTQYRDLGFLPHALLNYLVRLGWSHGDQEIFSLNEMIEYFDLSHLNKSACAFDLDKFSWLNQHYIKTDPIEGMLEPFAQQMRGLGVNALETPPLQAVMTAQRERAKTLLEMAERSRYFYQDIVLNTDAAQKHLTAACVPLLNDLALTFEAVPEAEWDATVLHQAVNRVAAQHQVGLGKVAQPLRVAVTGDTSSPSIDVTLSLIGKKTVMQRVYAAQQWIAKTVQKEAQKKG